MNKLAEIVAYKREVIARDKALLSEAELTRQLADAPVVRNFLEALQQSKGVGIIGEVKRASPSAGIIKAENFDPVQIARNYEAAGVDCISVLTDEKYFWGNLDYLFQIRNAVQIPLLRKDFIIEQYQILQARIAGADAILLIAECLDDRELADLMNYTNQLGMTPLLEIFEPENLPRALKVEPTLLGINNRNLKNFETSLNHTINLAQGVPQDILLVSESAIKTVEDIQTVLSAGARAVLVGETLMRTGNVEEVVEAFKAVR